MKFKRFTKPGFPKQIGRKLLGRFFDRFKDGLAEKKIELPAGALKDDEYFKELSRVCGEGGGATDLVQQRNLGLDEAEAIRNLRRRQHELEAVLDDDEATEPVEAEALRELEEIAEFQRQHPWRSRDCAQKCRINAARLRLRKALYSNTPPPTEARGVGGVAPESCAAKGALYSASHTEIMAPDL